METIRSISNRPKLFAFLALVLFSWLLGVGDRAPRGEVRTFPIPARLANLWTGIPIETDQKATEILETDDVTLMEYRLGQEPPVWFARVGGFGTRAAFHPPELCFVGSHFEVLERGKIAVMVNASERRLMRLVIGQGGERFEAWYWFTANGRMTPNYYQQQFWLVMDSIRRQPMVGTLVRISTPIEDPASSSRRLLAFLTALNMPNTKQLARKDDLATRLF